MADQEGTSMVPLELKDFTPEQKLEWSLLELTALKKQLQESEDIRGYELSNRQFKALLKKGVRLGRIREDNDEEGEKDDDDAMSVDFNPGPDTVKTMRMADGQTHSLHDNPPTKGSRDLKGTRYPAPFGGHKTDTRPFM